MRVADIRSIFLIFAQVEIWSYLSQRSNLPVA